MLKNIIKNSFIEKLYIFLTYNELNMNFSKHQNFKIKVIKIEPKNQILTFFFYEGTLHNFLNKYVKNH